MMNERSIFELRHIASELGIKYPSKFKRAELIAEIEAVKNGDKHASPPTKRGRPKKPLTTFAPDNAKIDAAIKSIDEAVSKLSAIRQELFLLKGDPEL